MTIGAIIIPYTFTNNTETADAVKVNQDFSVVAAGVNEVIAELDAAQGTRPSLVDRLAVSLNDDGTLKANALPVGSYDTRSHREISEDDDILESDSILFVDTTAGNVTLQLPPSATAVVAPIIVNIGLTGYAVILVPDGTDTIMGVDSYNMGTAGEFAQFALSGTSWWRIR